MAKNYLFSEDTSEEVQEWLGITKADILIYLAVGLVFATWVIQIRPLQWLLTLGVVISCIFSTKLGIKHNPKISKFTNTLKLVVYPLFSLILIGAAIFASIK
jgi:hypothetical protein